MADLLRLNQVRSGYGETVVLEDVDLALPGDGALAVLGRNGVGKSTLLATIMGHTTFHSGEILSTERPYRGFPCTNARAWASAWCRRSASSSPRSTCTRT